MRFPENLPEKGRIGFIAPSFGCASEPYISRFNNAIKKFKEMGYETVEGPNARVCVGIGKSNTPEACAAEINEFFTEDKSDVIISCGGGELMCEDLSYVDFDAIGKAQPKWYLGYSDNTNLTFLLPTLCDTAAVYGPCVSDFGMEPWHPSIADAFSTLTGKQEGIFVSEALENANASGSVHVPGSAKGVGVSEKEGDSLVFRNYDGWEKEWPERETNPCAPYNITEPYSQVIYDPKYEKNPNSFSDFSSNINQTSEDMDSKLQALASEESESQIYESKASVNEKAVEFEGRLLGGCLDVLAGLVGTRFDKVKEFADKYAEDGIIWFLESCDLNVMSMRRVLWNLDEAGWFKNVKGFIIGRPLQYQDDFNGFKPVNAYIDYLKKFNVPIVFNTDLGHLSPMIPMITGAMGKVEAKGNEFKITQTLK